MTNFANQVALMNAMYKLAINDRPTIPADVQDRLAKFKKTISEEVDEVDKIIAMAATEADPIKIAVAIADWLGDITVYCRSEALKYGIPLESVLDCIMTSNESKLDENGQPIYDENGKFQKGRNYAAPEAAIEKILRNTLG
jgi:hypothetical protein